MPMPQRFNMFALSPEPYKALIALEGTFQKGSIEKALRELVKLRVSQINGCAYCIDMHWNDARAGGETEQRLYGLDAWDESPYYTERERAALHWAEAVTRLHEGHVSDDVYEHVSAVLTPVEISDLTCVVAAINAWTRFAISARTTPGHYKPASAAMA
jgi:AhpD family alkylhydroperoxidase